MIYEYMFLNGISVLSAAKVFSYANEPNGDETKAIDGVFGLAVEFLYELLCWQTKGIPTSSGSWHNGTGF